MAKGKKEPAIAAPEAMPPCMYIDLNEKDADLVNKLKIGKKGTFRVSGKIVGLEKRVSEDHTFASIRIENPSVKAEGSNVFSEMAEEDED
jgi:hypothetical protein